MVSCDFIAILFGKFLNKHVSEKTMQKLSGILFFIVWNNWCHRNFGEVIIICRINYLDTLQYLQCCMKYVLLLKYKFDYHG